MTGRGPVTHIFLIFFVNLYTLKFSKLGDTLVKI